RSGDARDEDPSAHPRIDSANLAYSHVAIGPSGLRRMPLTVLALFDDGTIGDITDWPQLVLTSSDPNIVAVLPDGRLQAKKTDKDARITAELKLSSPSIDKTAVATAFAQPGWDEIGKAAVVKWVAGPIRPNESDLGSTNPDGVDAVVQGNANVLFI